MVDIGEYHFTKSERNKTVLVPQPSNDPSDPLVGSLVIRSTKRRRAGVLAMRVIELEPTVEDVRRCFCNNGYVRSSFRTSGHCANISAIGPRFPLRSCGRSPF